MPYGDIHYTNTFFNKSTHAQTSPNHPWRSLTAFLDSRSRQPFTDRLNSSGHRWCHPWVFFPFLWYRHVGELGVAACAAAAYSLARVTYNFDTFQRPQHGQYEKLENPTSAVASQKCLSHCFVQTSFKVWQPLSAHPLPLSIRSCVSERLWKCSNHTWNLNICTKDTVPLEGKKASDNKGSLWRKDLPFLSLTRLVGTLYLSKWLYCEFS